MNGQIQKQIRPFFMFRSTILIYQSLAKYPALSASGIFKASIASWAVQLVVSIKFLIELRMPFSSPCLSPSSIASFRICSIALHTSTFSPSIVKSKFKPVTSLITSADALSSCRNFALSFNKVVSAVLSPESEPVCRHTQSNWKHPQSEPYRSYIHSWADRFFPLRSFLKI